MTASGAVAVGIPAPVIALLAQPGLVGDEVDLGSVELANDSVGDQPADLRDGGEEPVGKGEHQMQPAASALAQAGRSPRCGGRRVFR